MYLFLRVISLGLLTCALLAAIFIVTTNALIAEDRTIMWGVTFSDSQAEYLGLNADEVYSALINNLGAKHIKLHINWNATEPTQGILDFDTLDRRVQEAEEHEVELILVIGLKTGRWPECHTPAWFLNVRDEQKSDEIVRYISTIVGRYADSPAVKYWQIENEPFLQFGTCLPWYYEQDTAVLKASVNAVRALDPDRQIIISESGELSSWTKAADLADIVGVTMYRSTWNKAEKTFGINPYTFLAPEFYSAKAAFIKHTYGKPVISIELQAEPWASKPLKEASLAEQALSMNPELFLENVEFAKQARLEGYYFWGAEWWYWMMVTHNQPAIWNSATQLFREQAAPGVVSTE